MNRLKSRSFVIGGILAGLCSHTWAASLPFGQVVTGAIGSVAQFNSYTFIGAASDVADFTLVTTSGSLVPKIQLYNPSGTLIASNYAGSPFACGGSTLEMNTVQLPVSGTYTVDVSDCSSTNSGSYGLYMQRTNNPAGAANLPFAQAASGTIVSAAQSNSYTFSANANDEIDFTLVTTSGSLVPKIRLYNPTGTLLSSNYSGSPFACGGSTLELNTVSLPTTGTYTVLVGDCSDTLSGTYEIYTQRTDNPTGPVGLLFGQTQTGTLSSASGSNTYTFSANANDTVDFTLVTTSGSLVPKIRIYTPTGSLLSSNYSGSPFACGGSTLELNTVSLPTTGTYTALIGDCSDTLTGTYTVYSQRTNNPAGAANLPFGQTETGLLGSTAASNTYTFSANATDVVDFTMVTTSGSLVPKIRLYNPIGTLLSSNYSGSPFSCGGSTLELNTVSLPTTGTYTVLVGDCSDTLTGNYAIYAQRTNNPAGPISLVFSQVQTGMIGSTAQSDTYTFPGSSGNVVDFTMVTTSGSLVPKIRLYNPTGTLLGSNYSGSPFSCGGSTVQLNSVTLTQSGTHTVLVGDCTDTLTGTYHISSQCFGACPLPAPVVTSVSPASVAAGGSAFTLTVSGSNFVSGSVVSWNGNSRVTTYISAIQLTAAILGTDIASIGSFPVTVLNPAPLAGPSNAVNVTVTTTSNPAPTLTSISPTSASAGGGAFTLTANGFNFLANSAVNWNGSPLVTTFLSATQLQAQVPATDIATAGSPLVTVFNPAPGGGTSAAQTFTVVGGSSPPAAPVLVSPPNGSTGVSVTPTLSWTASAGATSYDVYLGTPSQPPFVTNVTGTSYSPPALLGSNRYYWNIVARNGSGLTSSATWSFTTQVPTMSLSQSSLNYGNGGGVITDPQFVTVSFAGSAAIPWTASSNQANVRVLPTSGIGLGTLQVTASAGASASISISAPGAPNSPQSITVNIANVTPGSPFGSFDTPVNGATVSGSIAVTGWALDSIEVTGVNVMREPVAGEPASPPLILVGAATFVAGARPDVQALYPTTPFNYQAGWGYLLLTNELPNNGGAAGPGNGTYKLHAIATNKSGVSVDLGTKTITVNNAAATLPFGAIDTPGQGATVSGSVTNFGWALTPPTAGCPAANQPCIIPVNGSTIFVFVDGQSLGSPVYNLARCDVDQLFPGYANSGSTNCAQNGTSPGPVGYFNLDTTHLTNGVHTIAWSVTDNAGKAQGIGSRYFAVEN